MMRSPLYRDVRTLVGHSMRYLGIFSARYIGRHSHIDALGLDDPLGPMDNSQGTFDKKAAGLILKMVREGRIAGRAMLFVGPSSTGETAKALSMTQVLGLDVPPTVVAANASDVFSLSMSTMEAS
ncbi:TIP49 C-terminus-domain-containing protein [Armillaria fumosa]|nr:TIP49 C-terminus-domain-containing protein [Armillaria fumosa]